MEKLAYLIGVRRALEKLGTSAKGNPRIDSQDELGEYIRNAYRNDPTPDEPPDILGGMGQRPTTNTTSLSKMSLYSQWSKEEPKLRQVTSEEQSAGIEPSTPHHVVEPASTASPSQPKSNPPLLGQLRPGIDSAGGDRHKLGGSKNVVEQLRRLARRAGGHTPEEQFLLARAEAKNRGQYAAMMRRTAKQPRHPDFDSGHVTPAEYRQQASRDIAGGKRAKKDARGLLEEVLG